LTTRGIFFAGSDFASRTPIEVAQMGTGFGKRREGPDRAAFSHVGVETLHDLQSRRAASKAAEVCDLDAPVL
jgi:hypothetical protein